MSMQVLMIFEFLETLFFSHEESVFNRALISFNIQARALLRNEVMKIDRDLYKSSMIRFLSKL